MEFLKIILNMSIVGSIMSSIFLLMMFLTRKKFNSSWHYKVSIIILTFFIVPIGSFIDLPKYKISPISSMERVISQSIDEISRYEGILDTSETQEDIERSKDIIPIKDKTKEQMNSYDNIEKESKIDFHNNILLYLWIIGMTVLALLKIIPYIKFKSIVKNSLDIEDAYVVEMFNLYKERLGIDRKIDLKRCDHIGSPMLVGIFNPMVLIPKISGEEKIWEMVFLHELNHYKRRDILIKVLGFLVNIVHWFNPIIYILLKKMDIYCEYSIDEKVIGNMDIENRKYYGETILRLIDDSILRGKVLTTSMSSSGMELKSRLENILFFKRDSRSKYIKSLFVLTLILISGFIISYSVMASNEGNDNPLIAYIKDDGLYFTYLNNGKEVKAHEGTDFIYPIISKSGSYIAYTKGESLYVFDIENGEYREIVGGIEPHDTSYDWIDDETIVYATDERGFTKLNVSTGEEVEHIDEYIYSNLKASKDNLIYGKTWVTWTTEEGEFSFNRGIVEIDLNRYDEENKKFATEIIIEGKRSTDEMLGYSPTISDITEDGRYIYITERLSSGSTSADFGGIGIYDVKEKTHRDFTDIYNVEDVMAEEPIIVLPRKKNIVINPRDNTMISVINGGGREMFLNKEVVILDIDGDKNYRVTNFMDRDLVSMTPNFTIDGKKLLYSATVGVDLSKNIDFNETHKDWYRQPHNIYEYDLKTSKVEKVTEGDDFDFMPISISKDTILFGRYGEEEHFSLMKISNGKEEVISDNIRLGSEFYGYMEMEQTIDILYNTSR